MKILKQTPPLLALAALAALAVAGCGGGGEETTAAEKPTTEAPPALSKAALISQGDAICGEVNAAVGSLTSAESGADAEQVANLYVGMVQSLQNLGTPSESAGFTEFMGTAEELAKVEGEVKLAAEREEPTVAEKQTEAATALEEFQSQASVYGFEACGEGPSAPTPSSGGVAPAEEEEGGVYEEEGGVEPEPEYVEPEYVEPTPEEEVAPETGGAGGGFEEPAPEQPAPETGGESGGVGPG